MGSLYVIFQTIFTNFFQPNAWVPKIKMWLDTFGLDYNQQKTLAKYVAYYNGAVATQTTVKFADAVVNNASEHFMIIAVRVLDGAAATLAATDWALGCSNALAKNGTFSIVNNKSTELSDIPFTEFIPAAGDSGSGVLILEKPIMWVAQTGLSAIGSWITAPTTTNYNMRIELIGIKMI